MGDTLKKLKQRQGQRHSAEYFDHSHKNFDNKQNKLVWNMVLVDGFDTETLGNIKKAYFNVFDSKLRLLDI